MSSIKDIYLSELAKIRSMNKWLLLAVAVALIVLAILLITVFKRHPDINQEYLKEMAAKDSTLKYQQKTIESLQRFNSQQDSVIQNLNEAYKNNRPTETRIIHEYEKIPNTVNSLNREQLRREVSNY